jgi:hypothetical protein
VRRSDVAYALSLLVIGLLTFLAVVLSGGDLLAAIAPVVAAALLYAAVFGPLRACVLALMFLALVADAPQDFPMNGLWQSPLYSIGELLCNNWSKTFGIRSLSFSGMDALTLLLVARSMISPRSRPLAPPLRHALWAFLATVGAMAAIGIARGGDVDPAYWQVRQLVYLPIFAWLLSQTFETPEDHQLLVPVILGAALVKTAVGLYFHFAIAGPRELHSPVILSHSETMLFCLSITLVVVRWLEQPDAKSFTRCLWFVPTVVAAIWLNDRRIAYVGLGTVAALVWKLARVNAAKRAVARAGRIAVPLFALYALAGWHSDDAIFKPVAAIRTIVNPRSNVEAAGSDSSTRWRDIENFNLSQTMLAHPLGTGLGHEYVEAVKAPDISTEFALYRYIPHNSILWTMTAAGPAGFVVLWSLFLVAMYLAVRSHRLARTPLERMSAIGAACAMLLFLVQAWGDMGTQNWSTTWLVSAALAVAGKLSLSTGAWPSRLRLQVMHGLRPVFALEA